MAKDVKNINVEISYECWKKLKMLAIDKDSSLQEIVRDILERTVKNKRNDISLAEINSA